MKTRIIGTVCVFALLTPCARIGHAQAGRQTAPAPPAPQATPSPQEIFLWERAPGALGDAESDRPSITVTRRGRL